MNKSPRKSQPKAKALTKAVRKGDLWTVLREGKAWDEIGWDNGPFRIKGGHAIYQSVGYRCGPREGQTVLLARLGNYTGPQAIGLRQHNRRVTPDTILEFLAPHNSPAHEA
jgi:hypothetical protein